jgi:hypothetical protein
MAISDKSLSALPSVDNVERPKYLPGYMGFQEEAGSLRSPHTSQSEMKDDVVKQLTLLSKESDVWRALTTIGEYHKLFGATDPTFVNQALKLLTAAGPAFGVTDVIPKWRQYLMPWLTPPASPAKKGAK